MSFKNCFISERPDFRYDILDPDGELIAKAHLQTAADRAYIQRHGTSNKFVDGNMQIEIELEKYTTATLLKSLDWWVWDRAINMESIDDLSREIRQHLMNAVSEHENEIAEVTEDAEKN